MGDNDILKHLSALDRRFDYIDKRLDTMERSISEQIDDLAAVTGKSFIDLEERMTTLIKSQIEGLVIITGKSFALMHERFDQLEAHLQGDSADV
jgi:hypothetical protein